VAAPPLRMLKQLFKEAAIKMKAGGSGSVADGGDGSADGRQKLAELRADLDQLLDVNTNPDDTSEMLRLTTGLVEVLEQQQHASELWRGPAALHLLLELYTALRDKVTKETDATEPQLAIMGTVEAGIGLLDAQLRLPEPQRDQATLAAAVAELQGDGTAANAGLLDKADALPKSSTFFNFMLTAGKRCRELRERVAGFEAQVVILYGLIRLGIPPAAVPHFVLLMP